MSACVPRLPLCVLLASTTVATAAPAPEQVGRDVHPDPLYESVYCQQVANTLEDLGVGYRWATIVLDRRAGKSLDEIKAIEQRAFAHVPRTKDADTQALQQKCVARLETAEKQLAAKAPARPPPDAAPAARPRDAPAPPGSGTAPAQVARGLNPDPYFEAVYCADVAGTFKDAAAARRWNAIAHDRAGGRTRAQLAALDDLSMDLAPLAQDAEAKATFEQCRARLAYLDAPRPRARSAANAHAPVAVPWYEAAALSTERDPARRAALQSKLRAWNAYCVAAASALTSMTARNAAAFGLDARRTEHAQLLRSIGARREELVAQFRRLFRPDEESLARAFVDQQLANYRRGLDEHKGVEADLVAYAKQQFFQCSEGFERTWVNLAAVRSAPAVVRSPARTRT